MKALMLEPTATALWQRLIDEAETVCHRHLGVELQSYLVFLLIRFSDRPELANAVLATDYLRGTRQQGRLRTERLRDVGDQCLLYSGLFPRRAERKLVRISYFVDLGRSSYGELGRSMARRRAELFANLASAFVPLMEVLQTIRTLGGDPLGPLHAAELWQDTGSRRALAELQMASSAIPPPKNAATTDDHQH